MRPILVRPSLCIPVFALALAAAAAAVPDIRLGDDVVPTFQAVQLKLDAREADYGGSVRVELTVQKPTDHFRFHSENQTLERVVLRGAGGEVEASHEKEGDDVVIVRTAEPLAEGTYTLEIDFSSPFGTKTVGLYRMEQDGESYAFTQFEAADAREAFPCWDEPRFKFPYQLTLTVPEGHLAVSNTPVEKETAADGWRTVTFRPTKPLPSYLLAIATGPLETVDMPGLGVPGRIVTVKGQSRLAGLAAELTPPLLKALESYFDRPFPYAKLDFIAVPEFWPGGMENAGAIAYADRILLVDPDTVSAGQRRRMAAVIAHELAHQWFGDLVTMEWWDDLWLNESFADWMGEKITQQVFPEGRLDVSAAQSMERILGQDARVTTQPIRRKMESVDEAFLSLGVTYAKGRAVLDMFEQWLGPEVFRRGVNAYLEANAWGNATATDLWHALDQASGKPAAAALATFIEQPGFPRLEVEVLDGGRVRLSQERFRNYGASSPDFTWKVPVALKYPQGQTTVTRSLLLDTPRATVDLDLDESPAWIYPNAAAGGYYRWNVSPELLRALADQAGSVLTAPERVELLGNVAALLEAGTVAGDTYLDVVGSMAGDPDPRVVRSVILELEDVRTEFVTADLGDAFARYVRRTLGPALERIGVERQPGEDEAAAMVRPMLVGWLGREGHDEDLLARADALARSYMKDPGSVEPDLVGVAVDLAAFDGGGELFEEYRERFESAATPVDRGRYLSALGAFSDAALRRRALAYSLQGPLRPNEIFAIGRGMDDSAGRDLVFGWLADSFDQIKKRVPPVALTRLVFMGGGCSMERLERTRKFFSQPEHSAPGVEERLARVAEQVEDCVSLRQRQGEVVAKYLRAQ